MKNQVLEDLQVVLVLFFSLPFKSPIFFIKFLGGGRFSPLPRKNERSVLVSVSLHPNVGKTDFGEEKRDFCLGHKPYFLVIKILHQARAIFPRTEKGIMFKHSLVVFFLTFLSHLCFLWWWILFMTIILFCDVNLISSCQN